MKRLIICTMVLALLLLILIPDATINLIEATTAFLGEFARIVMSIIIEVWRLTPDALQPIWGVLICSIGFLVMLGQFVLKIIGRLGRQ